MNLLKALFGWSCHQKKERSYCLNGKCMVVCSRCAGIYWGFILALAFLFIAYGFFVTRAIVWLTAVMLMPLAVDGTGQLLGLWKSNNKLRFLTGYIAGMAVAYFYYGIYAELFFAAESVLIPSLFSMLPLIFALFLISLYENPPKKYANQIRIISDYVMLISMVLTIVISIMLFVLFLLIYG